MINFWLKNVILSVGVIVLMIIAHFPTMEWFGLLNNSKMLLITAVIVFLTYGFLQAKEDKYYAEDNKWYGKLLLLIVLVLSIVISEQLGGEPTLFATNSNLFYLLVGVGLIELFVSGQKHFKKKKTS